MKRRKNYYSLISFLKKITKVIPGEKKEINKLYDELQKIDGIASKGWVLEKIAELE